MIQVISTIAVLVKCLENVQKELNHTVIISSKFHLYALLVWLNIKIITGPKTLRIPLQLLHLWTAVTAFGHIFIDSKQIHVVCCAYC